MSEVGRKIVDIKIQDDDVSTQRVLDLDPERVDFLHTEGWNLASFGGHNDGGLTGHRGVLRGDEYINEDSIRLAIEEALGHTYEEVSSVYRQGPLASEQRQLRERIDSRLLALSRSGNMAVLARVLGLNEKTVDRALKRARAVEVSPIVKSPAVVTRTVSFLTGLEGARPRRRRHKGCPNSMRPEAKYRDGTVNLSDDEYARGLETHPGNPRYWEHRLELTPIRGTHRPAPKPVQTFPDEYPSDAAYAAFVDGVKG